MTRLLRPTVEAERNKSKQIPKEIIFRKYSFGKQPMIFHAKSSLSLSLSKYIQEGDVHALYQMVTQNTLRTREGKYVLETVLML